MNLDSFILKPLLKAATEPYKSLSVAKVLKDCSLQLQVLEAKAEWIEALDRLAKQIEETPRKLLTSAENSALDDPIVRTALAFLETSSGDKTARALLDFGANTKHLYDGDAARQLLEEFALTCDDVFGPAIFWLARQPCARHAFAPKDEDDSPPRGSNEEDLSRLPKTSNETSTKQLHEYFHQRWHLFAKKHQVNEDYELSDSEEKEADKLWRGDQRAQGMKSGAIRTKASRLGKMSKQKKTKFSPGD